MGAERGVPVVFVSHLGSGEVPALKALKDLILVSVELGPADRLGTSEDAAGGPARRVVARGDPHPSAAGHDLIAGEIFRALEAQGVWQRLAGLPQR